MALFTSCRLCSFACDKYKCLFDAKGERSEVYKVIVKYFHSWLLDAQTESTINVVCLECWQHISDFYSFQQWILSAQTQEEGPKFIIKEELSESTSVSDTNDFEIDNAATTDCKNNEILLEEVSMFECSHCMELFHTNEALETHYKLCLDNKSSNEEKNTKILNINKERLKNTFKCKTCDASFAHYGNLRRHVRKRHAVQPLLKWICKYCNKLFKKRSVLESHKNKYHNNQSSDDTQNTATQILDNKENNMEGSDTEISQIYQQFRNVKQDQQHATETSCTSMLSIKKYSEDEYMEFETDTNSSSTNVKTKQQIHRPAIEIVDVKSEIPTDEESDVDVINTNNMNSNELNSDSDEKVDNDLEESNVDLKCPRCNQHIKSYEKLKEHFDAKHPDERCYINCCHITLYEPQSILEHQRYHENPNAFKCTECGKCFKGRKGLSSHMLQVHSDSRSSYHLHLCCCKKSVERHEEYLAAGRSQLEYDTSVCCQRKKKILEDDELIAKWRKEIACEICKATFPYYSLMRSHSYYEHPGEKCYISCCQRKMSRISDTLEHIRFHLIPHLYRCQKCNVDFSGKSTLAKHMRNAHSDALPKKYRWACDECDKTFEIRQILTRHKNVHHSKKSD